MRANREVVLGAGVLTLLILAVVWMFSTIMATGYTSDAMLDLWGRSLLAEANGLSTGAIVGTFPPLANSPIVLIATAAPGHSEFLLASSVVVLGSTLAFAWYRSFIAQQRGAVVAILVTSALVANPLFPRALVEGPGWMFLLWGVWLLLIGMMELRRGYRLNDVILVAVALPIIVLSHPLGPIVAIASVPFIVAVLPPSQVLGSLLGVLLTILFPCIFAIAGLVYVNWTFAGSPLDFLTEIGQPVHSQTGSESQLLKTGIALMTLGATLPISVAFLFRSRKLGGLWLGELMALATLLCAILIGGLAGLLPGGALAGSLALPLLAATIRRWPLEPESNLALFVLLLIGFLGSGIAIWADTTKDNQRFIAAVMGRPFGPVNAEHAALAEALQDVNHVIFDAEVEPAIVALRGSAHGIVAAHHREFRLAMLKQSVSAPAVVIRDPHSPSGADRIGMKFPQLFAKGLPGYSRTFDGSTWRIYEARGAIR